MITLAQLAKHLEGAIVQCHPKLEVGLAKVGELTETMAVEYIGHELWKPLAASTVAEKTRLGYVGHVSATDPLLRTGSMRGSIRVLVEGLTEVVGSGEKVALWQEMGTHKIPPRPFLAKAAINSLPHAKDVFGEIAVSLLTPGKK
jgi:hypothetical protein